MMQNKNQNPTQAFPRLSTYLCTLLLLLLVPPTQGQTLLNSLVSPNEEIDGFFGCSVAGIEGDVNGDGVADVIVGAEGEDPGSNTGAAGGAYIVSGADGSILHTLASPNEERAGRFGASVAGVGGDVNADGVPDVIVGAYNEAPGSSPDGAGRGYIISGADGSVLDTLASPNEERLGYFGITMAGVGGDVNADGVPDVIVGAHNEDPGSSPDEAGRAYIMSGADGSVLHILASPNEEIDGYFGWPVAGVGGDVNADGVPDVIVGARESPGSSPDGAGRAYIFSGADGSVLDTLASPNEEIDGYFGWSVAGVGGDVNADGVADVIVGALNEAPGSSPDEAGRVYIFDVSASPVGLEDLPNGNPIALFPSPTKGSFTLDLGSLRQATVRILSIDGRLIMQKENLPGGQHQFSILQQADGLYFVEVLAQEDMKILKVVKE